MTESHERRRIARIPLSRAVVVREKLATWHGETEDVGARGCRIALGRVLTPGALVQLRFDRGDGGPLEAVGQVAWARRTAPLVAGVAFVSAPREPSGARVDNWIDALVADELRQELTRGPASTGSLAGLGGVALHLGTPPGAPLEASEMAVLRAARDGAPLSVLCGSPDGLRALVGLLERGVVSVRRTSTPDPEGWKLAFLLLAGSTSGAQGHPPETAQGAVIVPPLPEPLWRASAIEKMTEEYLQAEARKGAERVESEASGG